MKSRDNYIEEYIDYLFADEKDNPIYVPDVYQSKTDFKAGFNLAEELFKPKWVSVSEQEPPLNIELLIKSPNGLIHLASWRKAYNIFTCQNKDESSYDWKWMEIPQ